MQPRIINLELKKIIGKRLNMSLTDNKTFELWQGFMPARKEIKNKISNDLISMTVYQEPLKPGDLNQKFDKWAAVEVTDFDSLPVGMEKFNLESGLYAVFDYRGLSSDNSIFIYIFEKWLPNSDYLADHRPHFEILGEKYKNGDPDSEEEIWIPIKKK